MSDQEISLKTINDLRLGPERLRLRRIHYESGATFVPVCPICGRFVKADETIYHNYAGEFKSVGYLINSCIINLKDR